MSSSYYANENPGVGNELTPLRGVAAQHLLEHLGVRRKIFFTPQSYQEVFARYGLSRPAVHGAVDDLTRLGLARQRWAGKLLVVEVVAPGEAAPQPPPPSTAVPPPTAVPPRIVMVSSRGGAKWAR